ncbi:MAG: (2Fe-2S)-binding protein [Alphaproteobacteria bacterium]|nr:(2Fe-2S)-binding protein [Alphaproteobacteria bacterium]
MTRKLRDDRGLDRGVPFIFTVDGVAVTAYPGETIAAALIAQGHAGARRTARRGEPRGYYCGMGICWECVMIVDGLINTRTCRTEARPDMRIETQHGIGDQP